LDGAEDGILTGLRSTGYISLGFEDSSFLPCSTSEAWWLSWTSEIDLWEEYQRLATGPHEGLFAIVRGDRSEKGRFGHLGGYDRVFTVTELVLIRKAEPGDCRWPGTPDEPAG
ncbi:MAG: hypothetical protein R3282_03390, partial [Rhodothermales bacterium]|nr:hypothetical protein [Rhodothermales bacterium]